MTCTRRFPNEKLYEIVSRKIIEITHSHSDRGYNRPLKYWLHRQLSPLDSWELKICLPISGHPKNPAHSRTYGVLEQHPVPD